MRGILVLAALVLGGSPILQAADVVFSENFDALTPGLLATQGGWSDNSKMGEALVVGGDSLSAPNHLEIREGGAVHHAIETPTGTSGEIVLEFACRPAATEAGRNLQISLRDKSGAPVLFLNLRGSGRSVDIGRSVEELTEYPLQTPLPAGEWQKVRASWNRDRGQLHVTITSPDGTTEHFQGDLELAGEVPVRIIVGSTPHTQVGDWALDDLRLQTSP